MTPDQALHDEIIKLKATVAAKQAKIDKFKEHWTHMEELKDAAAKHADEYGRQRNAAVAENERMKQTVTQTQNELADATKDVDELMTELRSVRSERDTLRARVDTMNAFCESMKESMDGWLAGE